MKTKKVTRAVSLTEKTVQAIQNVADERFTGNFSLALETFLMEALSGQQAYREEHNLNRYVMMKMFFYLRENFRAREDGLLEKMDARFLQLCDEMKRSLIEEGVDYGPF